MIPSYVFTNPFFYSDIVALLIMAGLIVLLTIRTNNTLTIRWFKVYMLGTIAMSLIMDMGPLFTNTPFKYGLRNALPALGISLLVIGLLHFTLHFMGHEAILRKWWFIALVWGGAVVGLFQSWYFKAPTFGSSDFATVKLTPWGYYSSQPVQFGGGIIVVMSGIGLLLPIFLLIYSSFRSKNPVYRRQSRLIALGVSLSLVTALVNSALLAKFTYFPPIPIYGNVLLGCVITYALLKYGTSAIDPSAIVNNIVKIMNGAAIALDTDSKIIFANVSAGKLLGQREDQLIGQPIQKFIAHEYQDAFTDNILNSTADTDNTLHKSAIAPEEGKTIAVNVYSSKYRDKDGRSFGTILVLANVQQLEDLFQNARHLSQELGKEKAGVEQKVIDRTRELHEEQAKLKASIDSLDAGFLIIGPDGAVIMRNNAVNMIFSIGPNDPLSIEDLRKQIAHDPDTIAKLDNAYASRTQTEVKEVSYGSQIIRVFVAPVFSHENDEEVYIGAVVLVEDITEEKILERSKDEFFSIASHELRTPLTAIEGNSSLLMSIYGDKVPDPQLQKMLFDIHESSIRLIDIVNDFLDVSRLEQGKVTYDYSDVAVDEIIENVIYEMKAVLREKKLSIDFDQKTLGRLPHVWADKNRLKQVVYNLIGNAAKFTREGSITISAEAEGEHIKIRVIDTGPGIPLVSQKLLFRKFQQATHSILTRDTTRGTGLGLYISKMMVEAMGGMISLEKSEVGKGTTFSFTVPMATHEQTLLSAQTEHTDIDKGVIAPPPKEEPSDIPVSKEPDENQIKLGPDTKLLLVEDDPYVLRLYERFFGYSKIDVATAMNGQEAVDQAENLQPDVILMDVMMPIMNGLDALEVIKSNDKTEHIPIIMLSNFGEEETAQEAKAKGAAAYLIKSDYSPETLFREIEKILGRVSQEQREPEPANKS